MSVERQLELAAEYAFQADVELDTASELLEKRRYHATCFHAQQAAEGMVKAALLALDVPFARLHSLDALTQLFPGREGVAFDKLREDALLLDKLYLPTRYVDALGGIAPAKAFARREALAAISSARRIMRTAQAVLKRRQKKFGAGEKPFRRPA